VPLESVLYYDRWGRRPPETAGDGNDNDQSEVMR